MGKTIERPLPPDAMSGRFSVGIDENGEPADWDSAVARFLLAVMAQHSSASDVAPAERPAAAIPLLEQNEYSGLSPLSGSCMICST